MKMEVEIPDDILSILALLERCQTLARAQGELGSPLKLRIALTAAHFEAHSLAEHFAGIGISEAR